MAAKMQDIKTFQMDYQLSYILHSTTYEQNHQEGNNMFGDTLGDNFGHNFVQQMGVGFRARLEEAHDFMHGWFGGHYNMMIGSRNAGDVFASLGIEAPPSTDGTMNIVQVAAFDPVFFFHHTYVDYIYAEW
jgi:hypothetical protein